MPPEVERRLDERLAAFERETGSQVAILTVATTGDLPIEDYAQRVVERWRLGRAEADDGVLFLVARDDRTMRIEVGYGLEPQLTDLESGRILDGLVRPRFRDGDFAGGVESGTVAILDSLRGAELALPPPEAGDLGAAPVAERTVAMLVFVMVIGVFSLVALSAPGCAGWFLYLFLVPFYVAVPLALLGKAGLVLPVAWLVLYPILRVPFQRLARRHGGRRFGGGPRGGWWIGPFGGGGFGGGGFGGGGFGGGGFSGGGGSFGGGGASSSW